MDPQSRTHCQRHLADLAGRQKRHGRLQVEIHRQCRSPEDQGGTCSVSLGHLSRDGGFGGEVLFRFAGVPAGQRTALSPRQEWAADPAVAVADSKTEQRRDLRAGAGEQNLAKQLVTLLWFYWEFDYFCISIRLFTRRDIPFPPSTTFFLIEVKGVKSALRLDFIWIPPWAECKQSNYHGSTNVKLISPKLHSFWIPTI